MREPLFNPCMLHNDNNTHRNCRCNYCAHPSMCLWRRAVRCDVQRFCARDGHLKKIQDITSAVVWKIHKELSHGCELNYNSILSPFRDGSPGSRWSPEKRWDKLVSAQRKRRLKPWYWLIGFSEVSTVCFCTGNERIRI